VEAVRKKYNDVIRGTISHCSHDIAWQRCGVSADMKWPEFEGNSPCIVDIKREITVKVSAPVLERWH
jgi:hypothetical protein